MPRKTFHRDLEKLVTLGKKGSHLGKLVALEKMGQTWVTLLKITVLKIRITLRKVGLTWKYG